MKSPVPFFGGKSKIAGSVWKRLGDVRQYIEPFYGSGAVYLLRPTSHLSRSRNEVINDYNGFITNFWRAIHDDPEIVAHYAGGLPIESDLHARHLFLVSKSDGLVGLLDGDPSLANE